MQPQFTSVGKSRGGLVERTAQGAVLGAEGSPGTDWRGARLAKPPWNFEANGGH